MPSHLVRPRRALPLLLLAALLAGAAALVTVPRAGAAARVYYVDPASLGGRCSDDRTAAQNTLETPWCTVPRAVALAPGGSTIQLRGGTYPAVVILDTARPTPVTIAAYPKEVPTLASLDVERSTGLNFQGLSIPGGVIVRQGTFLNFTGNTVVAKFAGPRTASGFILWRVDYVNVRDNVIRNAYDGVNVLGSNPQSTHVVVQRNLFQGLGDDGVHMSGGVDHTVDSNEFWDVAPRKEVDLSAHADAIQSEAPTQGIVISNNHVHGGRGFLFQVATDDRTRRGYGHRNLTFFNNLLVGPDFGIRLASVQNVRIINNTVWGTSISTQSGLNVNNRSGTVNLTTSGVVLANNILKRWNFASPVTFTTRTNNLILNGPASKTDIAGAATFVNPAAGDFRLAKGSLGINTAMKSFAPVTDMRGAKRYGAPDMGALEWRP